MNKTIRPILFAAFVLSFLFQSCYSKEEFFWDFSDQQEVIYNFTQHMEETEIFNGDSASQTITGKGLIKVVPRNEEQASLTIADMKVDVTLSARDSVETQKVDVPDMVIPPMKTNGEFIDTNTSILYRLLFPLPQEPLRVNESSEQALRLPVDLGGKRAICTGSIKITRQKKSEYNGKRCEVLYAEFSLDKPELEKNMAEKYGFSFYGYGTYYYDLDSKQFLSADISSISQIRYTTILGSAEQQTSNRKSESSYHYELAD